LILFLLVEDRFETYIRIIGGKKSRFCFQPLIYSCGFTWSGTLIGLLQAFF